MKTIDTDKMNDANPDPISGEAGSHPVGTGVGAAAGGTAGAAIGAMGGPVGAVVGAAVGAVIGGLTGKGFAEGFDPTAEEAYWRENFKREPYYEADQTYEDYSPAYRLGYESRRQYAESRFEDAEDKIKDAWMQTKTTSRLSWEKAKRAVRAGWDRVERKFSEVLD